METLPKARPCAKCKKTKDAEHFRVVTRKGKRVLYSWCRPCEREYMKVYQAEYKKKNPEKVKGWVKARYWKVRNDPVKNQQRMDDQAIYYRLRKEREGKIVRNGIRTNGYVQTHAGNVLKVPAGPFRAWADRQEKAYPHIGAFALACGTSERRLHTLRNVGEEISYQSVENILWKEGSATVEALYPALDKTLEIA